MKAKSLKVRRRLSNLPLVCLQKWLRYSNLATQSSREGDEKITSNINFARFDKRNTKTERENPKPRIHPTSRDNKSHQAMNHKQQVEKMGWKTTKKLHPEGE